MQGVAFTLTSAGSSFCNVSVGSGKLPPVTVDVPPGCWSIGILEIIRKTKVKDFLKKERCVCALLYRLSRQASANVLLGRRTVINPEQAGGFFFGGGVGASEFR